MELRNLGSNQAQISFGGTVVLFSYNTPVACSIVGKGWYRTDKRWSVTTSKHINRWLDGVKAEEKPQEFFDNLAAKGK